MTSEVGDIEIQGAADPVLARLALSRVIDAGGDVDVLSKSAQEHLVMVLGYSVAAADFLVADPGELSALEDVERRTRDALDGELAETVGALGDEAGVRRFRRRAMLRVAARDLAGGNALEEIVGEISDIADACLCWAAARVAPGGGFSIVGLGKLGGSELNYASDVDLLFIHDDSMTAEEGQAAGAALIQLLSEPTREGLALRVDPTLRPGGRGGALSRTLGATLRYYAGEAVTWERQAMLKARAIVGEGARGFVREVMPFVYPEELTPQAIEEVRQTKVRLEEYVRARGKHETEVKRGWGGIRDVEFAVQLLQIVHGRRDSSLREPNTLRTLARLGRQGYVGGEDAAQLADAYRFLRTLEHRLQIVRDLQTHELPRDGHARTVLARSLALPDADALAALYARTTSTVRDIHERLFYRPLLEAFAGSARAPRPGTDRTATEELLAGLGFREPAQAFARLSELFDPRTRLGLVLTHLFPVMAPALALAAEPDAALVRLSRITELLQADDGVADALAADPPAARRLAALAGASGFATDLMVADPQRIFALTGDQGAAALAASDPGAALVRVAADYASRERDVPATGRALTEIAEQVLSAALTAARPALPFAVIGMGKLGARELQFASDLDVLFVYEGEGTAAAAEAARIAEAVVATARAAGFEPDASLRPEGRSGALARPLTAYLEYWQRWAEPWEFQSLLRTRTVATTLDEPSQSLARRFGAMAAEVAYPWQMPHEQGAAMLAMRRRIETERVKPPEAARLHFKLGFGSLADVQFAVELSLLRHGEANPGVRLTGTLEAIEALASANLIEESTARALGDAFVFLSDIKNALEVDRRLTAEALPSDPDAQTALARRLGYEEYPRQTFLEDYHRITQRARRAMERVFASPGEGD